MVTERKRITAQDIIDTFDADRPNDETAKYVARARLRNAATAHGLVLAHGGGGGVYERRKWFTWWPFGGREVARYSIWQYGWNELKVWRRIDTDDLRLWLGHANLIGWRVVLMDGDPP